MIIDYTGAILIPGNGGKECPGNGQYPVIECCCDECDYYLCCFDDADQVNCLDCTDKNCPRAGR